MLKPVQSQPGIHAFALLVMNGSLIAMMLPLARLVTEAGLSPIAYAFWQTLGAGALLALLCWRQWRWHLNVRIVRYCLVSGATGVAIPNALAFVVVGEVGPGFTSTLYAFPSIITLMFALLLRLERPNLRRLTGICMACLGCFWIVWAQVGHVPPAVMSWYALGLFVPVSLALGNVYRTIAWPEDGTPVALAAGMMLGASACLLLPIASTDIAVLPALQRPAMYPLVGVQMVLTALTYLGFFALQKRSNPVFLSQMGCIAALVGLFLGLVFFDEQYAAGVWLGVLIVLLGLWLTNARQTPDTASQNATGLQARAKTV